MYDQWHSFLVFLLELLGKMHSSSLRSKTRKDHVSLELREAVFITTNPRTKTRKEKKHSQEQRDIDTWWYHLRPRSSYTCSQLYSYTSPFVLYHFGVGFCHLQQIESWLWHSNSFQISPWDILMQIGQRNLDMFMPVEVMEFTKMVLIYKNVIKADCNLLPLSALLTTIHTFLEDHR